MLCAVFHHPVGTALLKAFSRCSFCNNLHSYHQKHKSGKLCRPERVHSGKKEVVGVADDPYMCHNDLSRILSFSDLHFVNFRHQKTFHFRKLLIFSSSWMLVDAKDDNL